MKTWTTGQLVAAMAVVAVIATAVGAGWLREPAGADITLPDSPLYNLAVTESIKGLSSDKEEPAPAEPCPDCGKIHAPAGAANANQGRSAPGVSTNLVYCENCKIYHPVAKPLNLDFQAPPPP